MCSLNKLSVAWPPALVCLVIGYVYGVFMLYIIMPQVARLTGGTPPLSDPNDTHHTPTFVEIWTVIVAFHVLFVMLLLSFFRSASTTPGEIPRTDMWMHGLFNIPQWKEDKLMNIITDASYSEEKIAEVTPFLKSLPVIERKLKTKGSKKGQLRYCSTCDLYKPDRTHHCRICNQCVLRMDHHCPWIANCVGFNNYKFFLLFLFYGWSTALFALLCMLPRVFRAFRPILDSKSFAFSDGPILAAFVLVSFLFTALFVFFWFHMSLVFNSLTTIELREKRNSDNDGVKHRWAVSHAKYDRGGRYENFLHIMGSPWMWFLPIKSDLTDTDGTYAEVSDFDSEGAKV